MIQPDRIIYSNRKTIALEITETGEFLVRAPKRVSEQEIFSFVASKQSWITKKQAKSKANLLTSSFVTGLEYSTLPYLGHELMIVYHAYQQVKADRFFLYLPLPAIRSKGVTFNRIAYDDSLLATQNKAYILSWYKEMAYKILSSRTDYYASLMSLHYKQVHITSARTSWGSCNCSGSINYSWHLITLSAFEIDYVIVHELSHILHRNHGPAFYREIATVLPDYKERILALKNHQWVLEILH